MPVQNAQGLLYCKETNEKRLDYELVAEAATSILEQQGAFNTAIMAEKLWRTFVPFLLQRKHVDKGINVTIDLVLRTIKTIMLSNHEFCQHVVLVSHQSPGEYPLIGPKGLLEAFLHMSIADAVTYWGEFISLIYHQLKDHNDIKTEADLRVIQDIFRSLLSRLHQHTVLSLLHTLLQCRPQCSQVLSKTMILREYPSIRQGCPKCGFQFDGAPNLISVAHGTNIRTRLLATECIAILLTNLPLSTWTQRSNGPHTMWSFQSKVIEAVEDFLRICICKPFQVKFAVALLKHVPFDNQKTLHALGVKLLEKASREGFADKVFETCLGGRLDTRGKLLQTPPPVETWIETIFDFTSMHSHPDQSIAVLQALPHLVLEQRTNMEAFTKSLRYGGPSMTRSAFCEALLKGRKLMVDDNRLSVDAGKNLIPTLLAALNSLCGQDLQCRSSYCSAIAYFYHCDWVSIPVLQRRECLENVLSFCKRSKYQSTKDRVDGFKALGHVCFSLIESERDLAASAIGADLYRRIVFTMAEASGNEAVQCMVLFSIGNTFHALNDSVNDRGLLQCSAVSRIVERCSFALQQREKDKIYANGMRASCRLTSWLLRHQVASMPIDEFAKKVLNGCAISLQAVSIDSEDQPRKLKHRIARNGCSACHSLGVLVECGLLAEKRFSTEVVDLLNSWIKAVSMFDQINEKLRLCLLTSLATIGQSELADIVSLVREGLWSVAIRSVFQHSIERPIEKLEEHGFDALVKMLSVSSLQHIEMAFDSINFQEGMVKDGFEALLLRPMRKETLEKLKSGIFSYGLEFSTEQKMHNLLSVVRDDDEEL